MQGALQDMIGNLQLPILWGKLVDLVKGVDKNIANGGGVGAIAGRVVGCVGCVGHGGRMRQVG